MARLGNLGVDVGVVWLGVMGRTGWVWVWFVQPYLPCYLGDMTCRDFHFVPQDIADEKVCDTRRVIEKGPSVASHLEWLVGSAMKGLGVCHV